MVRKEDFDADLTKIISYCSQCKKLFQLGSFIKCPKAKLKIDFYGKLQLSHTPHRAFNMKDYLEYLV